MASTINPQNEQETSYQRAYNGPYGTFAKIFLRPDINFDYLEEVASDLLSSEREHGERYTIDAGFRIFLLFFNVSIAKLATRESSSIEKVTWVRTLLRVFKSQDFLGLVSVGGLLRGYQLHKANQKRRIVGELISEVEDVFMELLDKILDEHFESADDDIKDTIAFLCGRCLASIPTRRLQHLRKKTKLLELIIKVIINNPRTFQGGQFIRDITEEIGAHKEIKWTKEFQSYKNLQTLSKQAPFTEMGPISRAVGKLIKIDEKEDLINILYHISDFAHNLYLLWEKCPLSRIVNEELMDGETKQATPLLWHIFKTILFTITMIFKAIVDNSLVKNGYCDKGEEKIDMLLTFSHLYFITIRFDLYGFPVYKEIFFNILNQLMETSLCNEVLDILKPIEVMKVLEDEIVEQKLLPTLCPYLTDNSKIYLFESAHSTVLAIYVTQKRISRDFSSYYSNLLLEGYPAYLSIEQLRAAYATMIKSLSETDDALVWYCLESLLNKIESLPTSNLELSEQKSTNITYTTKTNENETKESSESGSSDSITTTTAGTNNNETKESSESDSSNIYPNASEKDAISAALYLQRGHLLLTLIDQVGTVNLIFLETLLFKIKYLISLESNGIAKSALQKALFDVLSKNLDYTKKDAGVKWWLNEGREITGDIQS
ncbi:2411_t:CDS:10 [Ambispora leptoticha]|uniref:2411_t:CDS:1 n=1 Tax=Ambispora leptoticha TaxID=144679 RepID=A0A9N9DLS5_9GLOM|nr:2411_t:CDS:10 [Ambispora leptoticha]